MEEIALRDLWVVGGIVLGFEVNVLVVRVGQQASRVGLGRDGDTGAQAARPAALSVSDFLGVAAVVAIVFGVFVLPLLGFAGIAIVRHAVAFGIILFLGHVVSLVGHYELYGPRPKSYRYFPGQERICVGLVALLALAFLLVTALG